MEKIIFELKNIEVSFLDKTILNIDRLAIHQFDRIGIVGKNGAGKSTLLKLLAGIIQPSKGTVNRYANFGYFQQVEAPKNGEADPVLLGKLNVPQNNVGLSGGEQTRLKLAQLFTHYHDALLIDEPTTHLDREGISFLLDELRYYYGALVLVSHDRAVLNELVTTIWEVKDGKIVVYAGNYSDYTVQKQLEHKQQNEAREQYLKEKSRLEKAAREKMNKAKKMAKVSSGKRKEGTNRMFETKSKGTGQKALQSTAKAILQRIDRLPEVEEVKEEKPIVFHQPKALALHNKFPIMAERLTLRVEDHVLLEEVSFQIPLGKTIGITGKNGSGKSKLLKAIANKEAGLVISPKAKIGYFQQMSYQFASDETVLQFLKNRSDYNEGFLRTVLHSMQFAGTDIRKKVTSLSGGEAVRIQLCQLFLGEYNILLLDEPTNFLDIPAIEALERFIAGYRGTIIIVSHDQRFINHIAEVHFHISDKQIIQK